jgi:thiamine pyrophosphate-dependent acetolactate synthase large subunit-like protein
MSPQTYTGADGLVQQLEALGVTVVFGIPGVHNLAIFEALEDSPIRVILVRHEQTAVYAADGFARATGALGVAITTTGPGAANAAAAMGEARASRSPVLHISTQVSTEVLSGRSGVGALHESPGQRDMMATVAVWTARAMTASAIPQLVAKAAAEAFSLRRGPAFLEIPFDLLSEACESRPGGDRGVGRLAPDTRALSRASRRLRGSSKPIIWVGGGAVSSGAGPQVQALAEALDAPIVTTFSARGIVAASHPLVVGFPPHQASVTKLIEDSDATVFVGTDLDGMNTMGWRIAFPRPRVSINMVPQDSRRNYASDVVIEADAAATLDALVPMLPRRSSGKGSTPGAKRARAAAASASRSLAASKKLVPGFRFSKTIREALPEDSVTVCDMAVAGYWVAGYMQTEAPRRLQYPMGWGTLGFSVPAAVGAGASGRKTLVIAGDAGLMFGVGELATLVQEQLPVTVLVVNDAGYGMLRYDEEERYGRTFADRLEVPDLVALAGSFGMPAKRITEKGLAAGIRWGLKQDGPSLIELRARFDPPPTTSPAWHRKGAKEARP